MTRYIAFLRALNVGGNHNVKMDVLRQLFESFGYAEVETYIASGNVIFEAEPKSIQAMERGVEAKLQAALGYEVATFVRTAAELADIAAYQPFPESEIKTGDLVNVLFLGDTLDETTTQKVLALKTDSEDFHVHGREIYWLRRRNENSGVFSTVPLEKALRRPFTARGANTVKKMAAKYSKRS